MVAKGYPNKTIAGVLNISSWTVCTHLRRTHSAVVRPAYKISPLALYARRNAIRRQGRDLRNVVVELRNPHRIEGWKQGHGGSGAEILLRSCG